MKTFLVDQTPGTLYVGKAIVDMPAKDPAQGDAREIPLFQKARTGREITLNKSYRHLHQKLLEACVETTGISGHSLRTGGATPLSVSHDAGLVVEGLMGLSVSGTQWDYMHACRDHLEVEGLALARDGQVTLADLPGPYAGTQNKERAHPTIYNCANARVRSRWVGRPERYEH